MSSTNLPKFGRSLVALICLEHVLESDMKLFRPEAPFYLARQPGQTTACIFYVAGNLPSEQCFATLRAFGFTDLFCKYYTDCIRLGYWFIAFFPKGHPLLETSVRPDTAGKIVSMAAEGVDGLWIVKQTAPSLESAILVGDCLVRVVAGELMRLFEMGDLEPGKRKFIADSVRELATRLRKLAENIEDSDPQ